MALGGAEPAAGSGWTELAFGPFRFSSGLVLRRGDEGLPIGSRAAALLAELLAARGAMVPRARLIEAAWPGLTVSGRNLDAQVAALRRVFRGSGVSLVGAPGSGFALVVPGGISHRAEGGEAAAGAGDALAFGPFRLDLRQRLLTRDGAPVPLGSRAFAALQIIVAARGQVVDPETLTRAIWPETHVDPGNLRVHLSAIRKALGDDRRAPSYIGTVTGRGYRLLVPVRAAPAALPPPARLVGREAMLDRLGDLMGRAPLVTITGPGGIGKTSVALALAARHRESFPDGIHVVDLSGTTDARFVPSAIARALRVATAAEDPLGHLARLLRPARALLLLDNCERLVDAVAAAAETLMRAAPGLRILATSQEALRADGEWTHRLGPLDWPAATEGMTLAEARTHGAVELFAAAAAARGAAPLADADVPLLVEVCARLDGCPLALELAAAQLAAMSLAELSQRLDARLDFTASGAGRHSSLAALYDWTHDGLTPDEQVVLRRLACFPGSFRLGGALAVAGDGLLDERRVTAALTGLVRKSLVLRGADGPDTGYRLLETTRLYALRRLEAAGEVATARRRQALELRTRLGRAEDDWTDMTRDAWLERYAPAIDEVRLALDWAFAPGGEPRLGVQLTAGAMPLGLHAGLIDEFRDRAGAALARCPGLDPPELLAEMRLTTAFAVLDRPRHQPLGDRIASLDRAIALGERLGGRHRLEPLTMSATFHFGRGDYAAALAQARAVAELARSGRDELALLSADRILAQASHFAGLHRAAAESAGRVLSHPIRHIPFAYGNLQTDRRVSMRFVLARVRWIEGHADEAMRIADEAVAIAPEDGPLATAHALALAACPVALWRGDAAAGEYVERLARLCDRHGLWHWAHWAGLFRQVLAGAPGPLAVQDQLEADMLATLTGQTAGLPPMPAGAPAEANWAAPEILRARGEAARAAGDLPAAAALIERALALARRHGAPAWELRAALSLARLAAGTAAEAAALQRLAAIRARFEEGHGTADLVACDRVLAPRAA